MCLGRTHTFVWRSEDNLRGVIYLCLPFASHIELGLLPLAFDFVHRVLLLARDMVLQCSPCCP